MKLRDEHPALDYLRTGVVMTYTFGTLYIGYSMGEQWPRWQTILITVAMALIIAILVVAIGRLMRRR